jgi:hypothetical protein
MSLCVAPLQSFMRQSRTPSHACRIATDGRGARSVRANRRRSPMQDVGALELDAVCSSQASHLPQKTHRVGGVMPSRPLSCAAQSKRNDACRPRARRKRAPVAARTCHPLCQTCVSLLPLLSLLLTNSHRLLAGGGPTQRASQGVCAAQHSRARCPFGLWLGRLGARSQREGGKTHEWSAVLLLVRLPEVRGLRWWAHRVATAASP